MTIRFKCGKPEQWVMGNADNSNLRESRVEGMKALKEMTAL
jgi:hypothetical protein